MELGNFNNSIINIKIILYLKYSDITHIYVILLQPIILIDNMIMTDKKKNIKWLNSFQS